MEHAGPQTQRNLANLAERECEKREAAGFTSNWDAIRQTEAADRISIGERLGRRSMRVQSEAAQVNRALELLARHPEFEEYREFDRLLKELGE